MSANDRDKLDTLQQVLGVTFADVTYLLSAVTHRSFLNENREATQSHNERLEFLGDAVLELIVTDFLFAKYPDKQEGELTAIRAALVNTNTLSSLSTSLGVNEYLLLSKGEAKDVGRARQYILANTFEAIVGAMYLDQGYELARDFVARELFPRTDEIVEKRLWQDPKSRFQERAQEVTGITPSYQTLKEQGPDHDRTFTVGVFLGKDCIAQGEGRAKQEAEQKAAENGLIEKGWT
ncbi:ribonuclease III [Candidatus Kaiserbacteria bacterium]|nr:ribonuclease III [Candidatus Kaiserbacteria bacterium]